VRALASTYVRRIVTWIASRVTIGVSKLAVFTMTALWVLLTPVAAPGQSAFRIEEATIADIQRAITAGQVTCQDVVQAYLERAKAYNGTCTALVTEAGAPIPAAPGIVRAGSPLKFPTTTVPASKVLPRLGEYTGPPIEYGRMEPTMSDPSVQQQYGLRVGMPNAGQLNALETINLRGERSVTCKAGCDAHPSTGALPASCPKACEAFRRNPDALESAAQLDEQYGRNPDLTKLPLYCTVMSVKNWYDAKDMRATGGNDVAFAMDAPKVDSPDVADVRAKGAIVYAIATASNTGHTAQGPNTTASYLPEGNMQYGLWGGQACNPYDTERVPRGTSNGSGVSVSANLATCSICEQTSASCKGPASRNGIVNLLATKGVMMDGGLGYSNSGDRAGVHCRTVEDAVRVLDAVKGFETRDVYTAIPPAMIPKDPYASFLVGGAGASSKALQGMRIGIVREFMVKHVKNDEAISDQIDAEIKSVLRDRLGATLVESVDPLYTDDPNVPNMTYTFQDAFAEVLPNLVPEYFWQKTPAGELEFAVPGHDVTSMEYLVALALRQAPLSDEINLRRISAGLANPQGPFNVNVYLRARGDERVKDWASWVANAKFKSGAERASSTNATLVTDRRQRPDTVSYLKMQAALRLVVQKVMSENGIDAFVNPEQTTPPYKLGAAGEPQVNYRPAHSCCAGFTALLGGPEIEVPAGFNQIVYEPQYVLSADKTTYVEVTGAERSMMRNPMPISLMFWAGPGAEPALIKAASAYEGATHHRKPPPNFGPVRATTSQR
jgi:amidase